MSRAYVRNGTPVGNVSRCDSCDNAQVIRGYRESEVMVFCNYTYTHPIAVPYRVCECTNYQDRNRPSYDQMQKLALDIQPASSAKPAGFRIKPAKSATAEEGEQVAATEILTG